MNRRNAPIRTDSVLASVLAIVVICAAAMSAACNDATLPWQLDHDRIIAVRASPPHLPADGRSSLDLLITSEADGPAVVSPQTAAIVPPDIGMDGPPGLELPVLAIPENGGWTVVAPDAATIDAARTALGWPPDMPLPVRIAVTIEIAGQQLAAIKTIYLGGERDNPELGAVTIGDEPARDGLTVPTAADVSLRVDADETSDIDWLTSFGDLSDTADAIATLRAEEPAEGQVAVVVRDESGGVVWGLWQITAAE